LILFLCGVLAWTLLEYLLHRFVAHAFEPCGHHEDPADYSVGPSWLHVAAYLVGVVCVTPWAFSLGFVLSFTGYAWLHWQYHHGSVRLRYLRRLHAIHHYHDDHANYGVSSPLWDVVFNTYRGSL
jgi:sterol desaturase/sphingolipid hydroxylase (fatty acid hydroxylase superfamily)